MAGIGILNHQSTGFDAQDFMHNLFKRDIGCMRTRPAAPADVIANAIFRNALDGMIDQINHFTQPFHVILEGGWRHHAIISNSSARIIELNDKTGISNHFIFGAHGFGDGGRAIIIALVIFILAIRDDA